MTKFEIAKRLAKRVRKLDQELEKISKFASFELSRESEITEDIISFLGYEFCFQSYRLCKKIG